MHLHRMIVLVIIVACFSLGDCLKKHGIFDDDGAEFLMQEKNEVRYSELGDESDDSIFHVRSKMFILGAP